MNQYPDNTYTSENYSDVLTSRKREKFLFENNRERKSAYALHQPVITYKAPAKLVQNEFVMRITVDSSSITELRHLILKSCGDLVLFMRVKPIDHASKMKVWLCLSKSSVDTIISHIVRALPQAEFGKITPLLAA
ncbi:MAG: hypothetical protein HY254_23175 [Burkholderiales bacterium]|nr:hypothetical protein [Burkholderiales bacterium]